MTHYVIAFMLVLGSAAQAQAWTVHGLVYHGLKAAVTHCPVMPLVHGAVHGVVAVAKHL